MIAIGVGIDYSLLIVTRYRAALQRGLDPEAAVGEAVGTAGRSVVFAGATVMVSLLGMVVMSLPYLYGVAIGSALAVGVMVALSVTLLPAVLGFVGHHIDRLRVPFVKAEPRPAPHHWRSGGAGRSSTGRGGRRSPASCCSWCSAAPALSLRLGFPDAGNGPEVADQPPRLRHPHRRVRTGPQRRRCSSSPTSSAGGTLADVDALRSALAAVDGVDAVTPPAVNEAGDTAVLGVVPSTSPQDEATEALLRTVRDDVIPTTVAGTGIDALVGGLTASFLDQNRDHRRPAPAVHRRRRRAQLHPAAGRVPIGARRRQGRRS